MSSSKDEQVVDQKESLKQSFESNDKVQSLLATKLEEKVETHFSWEGEGEVCTQNTPNEQVHFEMEQKKNEDVAIKSNEEEIEV
jgi:hypothetical protein